MKELCVIIHPLKLKMGVCCVVLNILDSLNFFFPSVHVRSSLKNWVVAQEQ